MSINLSYLNLYHENALPDLQNRGEAQLLSYAESSTGPSSEAIWTVECKGNDLSVCPFGVDEDGDLLVNGDVKGVGKASQKATAKQAAAKQALEVISLILTSIVVILNHYHFKALTQG